MHRLIAKLDALIQRRRWVVIGGWVLVLVAALPFAAKQSDRLATGGFRVPNSSSQAVENELERDFPVFERSPLIAVIAPGPDATPRQVARQRVRVVQAVRGNADVRLASRKLAAVPVSTERPTLIPLRTGKGDDDTVDIGRDLRTELSINDDQAGPVRLHLVGYGALWSGLTETSKRNLAEAEAIGFPIVALILLAVFGSLAAAALPLALGFGAVMVTGALIYFLSLGMNMSVFVTNMASMVGIGVAVDYSLFVLARFREEVRAGRSLDEARSRAMATSGVAVLFSGLTVIASLAALWLVPNNAIRSMAVGAILVVGVSMLASATLLPALIRRFGHRVVAPGRVVKRLRLLRRRRPPRDGGFWRRWTAGVMRRPVLSVLLAGGLLLLLAAPVLDMKTGIGATNQFPDDSEVLAGARAASAVGEPGAVQPVQVLVESSRGKVDSGSIAQVRRRLAADSEVKRVEKTRFSRDRQSAALVAISRESGEAESTTALVRRLRSELPAGAGPGERVRVGGGTAALNDINDMINRSMWKIVVFVLGLSFFVLVILLRSIVLPLKAVVMNLLSVGAAYGVLVAVFQWGWADSLFGFDSPGYVDWMTPPLVLAVVFGLSMDYEVFLLTRIRERYEATGDTTKAVTEGLASSARTISSAALIMVSVFAVFIGTGVESIKEIGLGNAVAIGVDATIVRLVLMPAAMKLFGRWNWWLPRPLERALPAAPEALPRPVASPVPAGSGQTP
jgi:uncharacterized membrane protein YdfJ with MMPL/SSD domain